MAIDFIRQRVYTDKVTGFLKFPPNAMFTGSRRLFICIEAGERDYTVLSPVFSAYYFSLMPNVSPCIPLANGFGPDGLKSYPAEMPTRYSTGNRRTRSNYSYHLQLGEHSLLTSGVYWVAVGPESFRDPNFPED